MFAVSKARRTDASANKLARDRDVQVYALGHTTRELDRLSLQARMLEPPTRRLFLDAGLKPGMRVLDLGCGSGDVSLLAAEIVGPTGEVIGIDQAGAAIERASSRAAAQGLTHVRFTQSDVDTFRSDQLFDAIVGRLVLMYLPDPASALRRLSRVLRPGGILAFLEYDTEAARGIPEGPLLQRCREWYTAAFHASGADMCMGPRLYRTFVAAGLPTPSMRLEGAIGGGPDFFGYQLIAEVIRSMLPLLEKIGAATACEVDIDTLEERLREEFVRGGGVFIVPELIGAWARLPKHRGSPLEAL
jgi:ubiquinone/menaquinone biosynthesis C-methylase UbiE